MLINKNNPTYRGFGCIYCKKIKINPMNDIQEKLL